MRAWLALALGLAIVVPARADAQDGPVPFISSVSPISVAPGSPGFTLTVHGTHFAPDSIVRWNGVDHVPTTITASRIEVEIADSEIAIAGTIAVTVVTPSVDAGVSNAALVHVARAISSFTFVPLVTFTPATPYETAPVTTIVADFDNDDRLDVMSADQGAASLLLFPGAGDTTPGSLQSIDGPHALAAGDFNADGVPDVAVINLGSSRVSVLLGSGVGSFTRSDLDVGRQPRSIVLGDVNADGSLDVIASVAEPGGIVVLPGNGDGTFGPSEDFTIGSDAILIGAADFDGDGRLDIALATENAAAVTILAGRVLARADVAVADKRFDRTTSATVTSCSVSGLLPGDSVGCTGTAAFDSADPGASKTVAVTNLALSGADASSYALASTAVSTTATIRANRVPEIADPGVQNAYQSLAYMLAPSAEDADGDRLTWSAQGLPPGIAIESSTGLLSGIPTKTGAFTSAVIVSDGWDSTLVWFRWNVAVPIPGPATALTPLGSMTTRTPAFSWSAAAMASYYALSITDGSAGSTSLSWYTPAQAGCGGGFGVCTVAAPRALAPGPVSWKVVTWNPFGYGPWSNTPAAVIEVSDPSVPAPLAGGPSGPATRTPTYTWTGVTGASWYQLSITDALDVVRDYWYTPTACVANACAAVPPGIGPGKAKWRVRAWRSTGAGAWSASVPFEATDAAPGKVTLVAPTGSIPTVTPTFTWNAMSIATYYLLQITDRDNVNIDRWYRPADAACAGGTGVCRATPALTLKAGVASWHVLAWNISGYGPWSDPQSVVIEIADPNATAPATVSPVDVTNIARPTYRWTAVSGAITYRLSVRNNGGTTSTFWYSSAAAGCGATTDCTATPPLTLTNGTADWQVQAWTRDGFGPWSASVALTVNIPAPLRRPPPVRDPAAVRLIEYGWDAPTPQFVRSHIREMEQRPFGGVVMQLPDGAGQVFRPDSWNPDTLPQAFPVLADIQWQTFDSNFLAMYAASSVDWYDDEQWQVVLAHAALLARAARECRCKGLMFDPEPYGPSPWNYAEQARASAHTFAEYEAMVRERGRSFMRTLQQEYPGIDVLTLHGLSYFLRANASPDADTRQTVLRSHAWGLMAAFLNGLLEESDGQTHIIDGQEHSYYAERPEDFARGDLEVREGAFPYVSPELTDKYVGHVETGLPLYSDWLFGYYRTSTPSLGDGLSDAGRARLAEHHAYYAMKNVDRYVWLYSEKMNWWTGENLPAGAEDALRSADRKFKAGETLGFDLTSIAGTGP